jgi:hypothetical protein
VGKFKFFKQRADRLRSWKATRRRQKAATAHESRYCRTRLVTRLLVEGFFVNLFFPPAPVFLTLGTMSQGGYSSSVTLPSFDGLMDLWELGNRPCPKCVHWLEMMESKGQTENQRAIHQCTMQAGWCVNRKQFFSVFLSLRLTTQSPMYYHTHVCSVVVCTSGVWLLEFLKNYQLCFFFPVSEQFIPVISKI